MVNILFISATSDYGGGPQHLYDLVSRLDKTYNITVLMPDNGVFWEKFSNLNINIKKIPYRWFSLLSAIMLCYYTKKQSIDLIHSHGKGGDVYGRFISLITGIPLVNSKLEINMRLSKQAWAVHLSVLFVA